LIFAIEKIYFRREKTIEKINLKNQTFDPKNQINKDLFDFELK